MIGFKRRFEVLGGMHVNKIDNQEIMVSVICNTFNQEAYIRQTLEGIVKQNTDFLFEVLIHDDASTDNTRTIIKEFELRYPHIIKPIYQDENQYSQNISVTNRYQLTRAKGKYIAFCEGDDYWTDEKKLKIQVEALENNPNINICAHAVSIIRDKDVDGVVRPFFKDCIFSPEQVILYGGDFVGTCSLMYRRIMDEKMPSFRKNTSLDYTIQIHGALNGGLLYIDRNMGTYRIGSNGSWTNRILRVPQKAITHYEKMEKLLDNINKDTEYKYADVIDFSITEYEFKKAYALKDEKRLRKAAKKLRFFRNMKIYEKYSIKMRIKIGIKYQFPFLYEYFHKK